ncbi:LysE family translocator [Arsenicitalea aurantiaca]|uniref:LysE family translocator n=1 Tax=Arsenicitalea aurantiaca TaxID=1783274 RepID=A0A433XFH4_9HYPH|nr:LysE family translocator [Arsenicitalea aurantiaca]RUT32835.1 LysE family translocator [Arsenicitalea aurantiaca]
MIDAGALTLYIAAALLLAITPGPGIFYVAARTLSGGRAEGIASSFGTGVGGIVHVVAGAAGVSAIVLASAELFTLLKILGVIYLAWIGVRTILAARREPLRFSIDNGGAAPSGVRRAFREGVIVEALNPKTAAFFLAFIPHFVDPSTGSVALQFVVLGLVSVTLNTLADIVVAFIAGRICDGATTRPKLVRRLRAFSGASMIMLAALLATARRPG